MSGFLKAENFLEETNLSTSSSVLIANALEHRVKDDRLVRRMVSGKCSTSYKSNKLVTGEPRVLFITDQPESQYVKILNANLNRNRTNSKGRARRHCPAFSAMKVINMKDVILNDDATFKPITYPLSDSWADIIAIDISLNNNSTNYRSNIHQSKDSRPKITLITMPMVLPARTIRHSLSNNACIINEIPMIYSINLPNNITITDYIHLEIYSYLIMQSMNNNARKKSSSWILKSTRNKATVIKGTNTLLTKITFLSGVFPKHPFFSGVRMNSQTMWVRDNLITMIHPDRNSITTYFPGLLQPEAKTNDIPF